MLKKILQYYLAHRKVIVTIAILITFLVTTLFLYNNFFLAMQNLSKLYELQGSTNFSVIDTNAVNKAFTDLEQKQDYKLGDIDSVNSPF